MSVSEDLTEVRTLRNAGSHDPGLPTMECNGYAHHLPLCPTRPSDPYPYPSPGLPTPAPNPRQAFRRVAMRVHPDRFHAQPDSPLAAAAPEVSTCL